MKIKSYLSFNGNAEEALNFYADVFNGTIEEICRFEDYKDFKVDDNYKEKIAHSDFVFNGCAITMADTIPGTKTDFGSGHIITVFCESEQQTKDIYAKLSEGGQIRCELCQPTFAKQYGEVSDKFGVPWALIME